MIRARLSSRDRRALAVGCAVVAFALLWTYVVTPYMRALAHTRARLDATRVLLARELELVRLAPVIAAAAERAAGRLWDVAPRLFAGEKDGLAHAALADYVRAHAREARAHIASVTPVAGAGEDVSAAESSPMRLREIALRVAGESDLEGLLTLITRLEGGAKLARVRGLTVDAKAQQPGGALVLSFHFDVVALALPDSAARAAEAET
jgi:hypothetical protein